TGAFPRLRGKVGGSVRREIVERGDLMRPPPRPSPARGGGGRVVALLAAHRRLPPLPGEGWDGGSVRCEIVECGALMRPPPRPSPAAGEGACPGPFRREPVLSPACGGGACSAPSPRGAARPAGPALATRRAFGWFARQRRAGRSFPPPQVAGGAGVQAG